jgi:carbon storage regulator CsrA
MLVLSRKRDEEIIVFTPDGLLRIMVVDVRGNKVRVGVDGPADYDVKRLELCTKEMLKDGS